MGGLCKTQKPCRGFCRHGRRRPPCAPAPPIRPAGQEKALFSTLGRTRSSSAHWLFTSQRRAAHSAARALCAGITFCKIPPAHKRSLPAVRSSCFARGAARLAVAGQAFRAMKNACRSLWRTDAFGNAMRAQAMLRRRIFPTPGARPAPSSGPPASGPVQAARGSLIRTRRFARLEMRPASPLCLSAARPPRYSCGVWGQAAKARPAPSRAGSM